MNKIAVKRLIHDLEYRLTDHGYESDSWYLPNETPRSEIEGIIDRAIFPLFDSEDKEYIKISEGIYLYSSGKVTLDGYHISMDILNTEEKVDVFFTGLLSVLLEIDKEYILLQQ